MTMRRKWLDTGTACLALCAAALTIAAVLSGSPALADESREERSAWLGVMLSGDEGGAVKVVGVTPGSPANSAGIRKGDTIVRVDGTNVDDVAGLIGVIRGHEPGDDVTLSLVDADGAARDVTATLGTRNRKVVIRGGDGSGFSVEEILEHVGEGLGALPEHFGSMLGWTSEDGEHGDDAKPVAFLGVTLLQPSDDLRRGLGGVEGVGVLVNEVVEESAAAAAGLLAGDLITHLDGDEVGSAMSLTKAVRAKEPGDAVSIGLIREGSAMTLGATLGETKGMHRFRIIHPGSMHGLPDGLHLDHLGETRHGAPGDLGLDSATVLPLPGGLDLEGLDETIREALEKAFEGLELEGANTFVAPGGRVIIHPDVHHRHPQGHDREGGEKRPGPARDVAGPLHT